MRYEAAIELISEGVRKVSICSNGVELAYAEVIENWIHDPGFTRYFIELLKSSPFAACFWETPPVRRSTLGRVFEYVEVESTLLVKTGANPRPFTEHFHHADTDAVVVFPNLGGDAQLVVPCPVDASSSYPHLAAFVKTAPDKQIETLWRKVGEEADRLVGDKNIWISTAGTGVAWLHVRLDTFPKYYTYSPYRDSELMA